MPQYHIWTVGCQVNTADSAKLAAGLRRLGMDPTDQPQDADLVVLNTCAVRQHAEDKAQAKLGSLKHLKQRNPNLRIAVMGCMVGPHTARGDDPITKRFSFVDTWAQPQRFDQVVNLLDLPGMTDLPEVEDDGGEFWPAGWTDVFPDSTQPTAYVPVIEGCDKFCTYCIVPLRRGRERSRPIDEIAREIEAHTQRGVREVTLLGQTVEAYGKDQPPVDPTTEHADLSDLMRAIHDLPKLQRIRQLTSYPPDMTDRILEGMRDLPKVCEAFSLPVQAGSDDVLTNMRRGYSVAQFRERVDKVRQLWPEVSISTDVIVGFPGESERDFQDTYDLLEELRFDKVHVAAYSPRTGTFAQKNQPDDVPRDTKMERLHRVEELQRDISFEINNRYLLRDVEVLLESTKPSDRDGFERHTGRTRTMKLVHFDAPIGDHQPGDMLTVAVTRVGAWSLQGEPALANSHAADSRDPVLEAPAARHPTVAVLVVIFTVIDGSLHVLLIERSAPPAEGQWAIPGGAILHGESMDEAAVRKLEQETGVTDVFLEQLYTFSDLDPSPEGGSIGVAWFALVENQAVRLAIRPAWQPKWWSLDDLPPLAFDNEAVIEVARERLINKLEYTDAAYSLLPPRFTMRELQEVYEAILGRPARQAKLPPTPALKRFHPGHARKASRRSAPTRTALRLREPRRPKTSRQRLTAPDRSYLTTTYLICKNCAYWIVSK